MTPETPSVTYCGECGRERTEAEKGTRTPCPSCGSTSFGTRIHMEFGVIHLARLNVSIETQKAFETATWTAIFGEMDLAELRAVGEGSTNPIPEIPGGYEIDVKGIAKHIYDERTGHDEWKKPHNYIPIIISIFAVIASIIAIAIALESKSI